MNRDTILQTAKDYAVNPGIVQTIYDNDPDNFYVNMELHIKERAHVNSMVAELENKPTPSLQERVDLFNSTNALEITATNQALLKLINDLNTALKAAEEVNSTAVVCYAAVKAKNKRLTEIVFGLDNAIEWALGYDTNHDVEFLPPENAPRYWWRKQLRKMRDDATKQETETLFKALKP